MHDRYNLGRIPPQTSQSTYITDRSRFRRKQAVPPGRPSSVSQADSSYINDVSLPVNKNSSEEHISPPYIDTGPLDYDLPAAEPRPYIQPAIDPRPQRSQVLKRQFVQSPAPAIQTDSPRSLWASLHTLIQPRVVLIAMACLVFGLGLLVDLQTVQTNHSAKAQVAALAKAATGSSSGVPGEDKPNSNNFNNYQVAPNLPKYLKIPVLRVNARVRSLSVNNKNALQAPTNIYDTGWYDESARPGDPGEDGAVVIDGHVHGPTLPGVFVSLGKLRSGNVIQIVRGDNKLFTYKVVKVQNYSAATLNVAILLASIQPGQPGLNLITCGGPYSRASGEYTQRTIVFAVQT